MKYFTRAKDKEKKLYLSYMYRLDVELKRYVEIIQSFFLFVVLFSCASNVFSNVSISDKKKKCK